MDLPIGLCFSLSLVLTLPLSPSTLGGKEAALPRADSADAGTAGPQKTDTLQDSSKGMKGASIGNYSKYVEYADGH